MVYNLLRSDGESEDSSENEDMCNNHNDIGARFERSLIQLRTDMQAARLMQDQRVIRARAALEAARARFDEALTLRNEVRNVSNKMYFNLSSINQSRSQKNKPLHASIYI